MAATLTAANYSLSGIVGADAVTLNDPAAGTYDSRNAGTGKTVSVAGLAISGASASNYVLASNVLSAAIGVIDPAALSITANDISAAALSLAQPTATETGFVGGDTSSIVTGLQFGLFPVTGDALHYDIVPFGASALNYTITYFGGLLTLTPPPPNSFTTPLIGNGGFTSSFVLSGSFGSFAFSNVATAALGAGDTVLLFEDGLPGVIRPFDAIALGDYSNGTSPSDRLVPAP